MDGGSTDGSSSDGGTVADGGSSTDDGSSTVADGSGSTDGSGSAPLFSHHSVLYIMKQCATRTVFATIPTILLQKKA